MTLSGSALQDLARETARSLAEVTEGYPFTDALLVFKVAGHVFLIVTEDPDEQIITVKGEPAQMDALTRRHPSVQPGRYLDKRHWLSIGAGPGITRSLVVALIEDSYDLVVAGLSRAEQHRIRAGRD